MQTGNLDGLGIAELRNYKFQNLSSAPTTNVSEGRFYMNTTDHILYVYNGTEWVNALTQGKEYLEGIGINISANNTISVDFTEVATASQGTLADSAVQPEDLADVATSGDYDDLINKPAINNGTLTIQKNGTDVATFGANQSTNQTANIIVPTQASDINAVPTTRTVNGKALSSDITLDSDDVGALPDTTTINDLTTTAQQNALNSGITSGLVTQIGTNQTDISTINGKIPSQASTTNQLADKEFVNSSVSTATARFKGTYNSVSALDNITGMDDNDYAFVTGTDLDGNTYYDRYKYDGSDWVFEYRLNNSSFTSAQWSAINSGITNALVTQIGTNESDISDLENNKQDKLTAGANITITNNTISATDTTYTAGTGINITNGVISNTNVSAEWGNIQGTLSDQTDLQNALNSKSTVTFVDWTV